MSTVSTEYPKNSPIYKEHIIELLADDVTGANISLRVSGYRGVRKVTTGITGLWQPRVHSDN